MKYLNIQPSLSTTLPESRYGVDLDYFPSQNGDERFTVTIDNGQSYDEAEHVTIRSGDIRVLAEILAEIVSVMDTGRGYQS